MNKIYQVVLRGSEWHVHMPNAGRGVHGSEDKARVMAWACDEAKRVHGEVRVCDRGGRVETIYTYEDGTEVRKTPNS